VPVLRNTDIEQVAEQIPEPAIALVTVGEPDLDRILAALPRGWRFSTVLIQDELLPRNRQAHNFVDPTVAAE
jgi:hypothetical protein